MVAPEQQLAQFVSAFAPAVAERATAAIAAMRARLPGANLLVYDNFNALAVAFCATRRKGDILCSIAVYPRWVSLFLMGGQALDDPHRLLRGSGNTMRHVVLDSAEKLGDPRVQALIDQTVARAAVPLQADGGQVVIAAVAPKKRGRVT